MRIKTARPASMRLYALLLLLLCLVPLAVVGCTPGQNVSVPADSAKALEEGKALEKKAADKEAAKETVEAGRLYNTAAQYWAAAARQHAGTTAGFQALLSEAALYQEKLKNNAQAQRVLRDALKQYPPSSFADLNAQAQQRYDALIAQMDRDFSKTVYYKVMDGLVKLVGGSDVLAIFIISIGITLALWPLRAKYYRSLKEMQRYQPELKKIQEKYKSDKALLQEKTMEFFKEHGYNPMGGCLPMLAQMPILWLLYHAISVYQFQFVDSHFLWINPTTAAMSSQWPSPLTGAIARNMAEQDLPLLFIYALSMYVQTKMTPAADPAQAEQQKMMAVVMPVMFFIMMLQWHLPSAFVLYWFLSNLFSVTQQWWINRSIGDLPPIVLSPSGSAAVSGGSAATVEAKPLTRNQRLISPKNRKKGRK